MPVPCRWAVKLVDWDPEQQEWKYLLNLLSRESQVEVQRFKFQPDQRRSLVSRLLQRRCASEACSVPFSDIQLQRTKGGKPFCASPWNRALAPNFNFNVSHEVAVKAVSQSRSLMLLKLAKSVLQGDYVVLAAEPLCVCGIDVAAPPHARSTKAQSTSDLFRSFRQQFTANEVSSQAHMYPCKSSTKVLCTDAWPSMSTCSGTPLKALEMKLHRCRPSRSTGV